MSESIGIGSPEIALIGLGVIGGSVALKLRARGSRVRGYSSAAADARAAEAAGVEVTTTIEDAVRGVGLVLLAVPLDVLALVSREVIANAPATATIFHAGSLLASLATELDEGQHRRVIGTHPMAGSHRRGFDGASATLFQGATVFVERRATARQREDAELFWSMAGARRIEYVDASDHDDAMAWISHLPQLVSTSLAITLSERQGEPRISPGPGARDTTRLALSSFDMWQPILSRAPAATLHALRVFEEQVRTLRKALEGQDWSAAQAMWTAAASWRAKHDGGTTR